MPATAHPWELRFDWTLSVLHWGGLSLALFLATIDLGATPQVMLAGFTVGSYVVIMQVLPRRFRQSARIGEVMAVIGVGVSLIAIALTGGSTSPFLIFLAAPSFFAAAFLGLRIGLETAMLSGAGLVFVTVTLGQDLAEGQVLQPVALYILIAVTFSQARRLLVEERERGDALQEASLRNLDKMERMAAAHNLLASLSELATTSELNPMTVGQTALRDLALIVHFRGGQVVIEGDNGPTVVSSRGDVGPEDEATTFPIVIGTRQEGALHLWPQPGEPLEPMRTMIEEALRPVAMAFDNIRLLQDIAARAVREERVRLARELHDEVAPSLASLGLGIDMAIHQHDPGPGLARHLETMRQRVTGLVEEVRHIVADLRGESMRSIVEQSHQLAAEVGADGPAIFIDVAERRPPRPGIAGELSSILTEAVRNAVEHSGAKTIRISGEIDHYRGRLAIEDDGKGFDPELQQRGHFGLIGMKERAQEIGARLEMSTGPDAGTTITVSWEQ